MPPLISDGVLLATVLGIIEDNPKPNLLFGAPAVSLPHIASNLDIPVSHLVAKQILDVITPLGDTLFDIPRKAVYKELTRGGGKEGWIVFEERGTADSEKVEREGRRAVPKEGTGASQRSKTDLEPELPPITPAPRRAAMVTVSRPPPTTNSRPSITERSIEVGVSDTAPARHVSPPLSDSARPSPEVMTQPRPSTMNTLGVSHPITLQRDPKPPGGQFPAHPESASATKADEKPKGLSFLKPLFLGRKTKTLPPTASPFPKHSEPTTSVEAAPKEMESNYDIIDLYDLDGDSGRGRYPTFPETEPEKVIMDLKDKTGFGDLQERARERRLGGNKMQDEVVGVAGTRTGEEEGEDGKRGFDEIVPERRVGESAREIQLDEDVEDSNVTLPRRSKQKANDDGVPERNENIRVGSEDSEIYVNESTRDDTMTGTPGSEGFDLYLDKSSDETSVHESTPPPTPFLIKAFEDLPFGFDISSSGMVEWLAERWQLLLAEMIVLLGLAYFIQASGF